ncbi:ABC transporter permease [Flavobacterium urocaniciphilum]|uniref:Lipoprotein-releasing system permease protein n=1 Tax=Flavobacterium urocaniciphilum TaxID=1299341 RepID=A0A1H9A8A0_9FLAO|nr:FtsX-like permease family protein [Flavobacterium urocaniciphilum]SEP72962.1 lipoprotein-releasing system permease protein [Flavobacterium urocaniciphilum]
MNFPFYIAKRYAFSLSKTTAINIITVIASFGIIVGAAALFVVLSVFSGLRDFSLSFANATDPDLRIEANSGKSFFISENQEQQLKNSKLFTKYSKVVEERALFFYKNKEQVAYLKGVDNQYIQVNNFNNYLFAGNWLEPNSNEVVVGSGISRRLSLGLLDYNNVLEVFVPKPGSGMIENPDDAFNKSPLLTSGIFQVSEDIDDKYIFSSIDLAQGLLSYKPNQITFVEFKLAPNVIEEDAVATINSIFKNQVKIKNRAQLNDALYKMLNTENIVVYLIFTLVIIIALFNLIGAIIMMIIEKKGNLKTLYNLGVEIKHLKNIFLFQGNIISISGGIVGLFIGIVIVYLQQQFELIMITPTLAYPVRMEIINVIIVFATIVILGFIASKIASSTVSKKLLE